MTSAAYGVGRDSFTEGVAVGCPVSPFFASTARLGVLHDEERAHPARPVQQSALSLWGYPGASGTGTQPHNAVNLNHASNNPYLLKTELRSLEAFLAVQ